MILILKMEDGSTKPIDDTMTVRSLLRLISKLPVETIIAGEVDSKDVLWEKQFNAADVMPTDFGKPRGK